VSAVRPCVVIPGIKGTGLENFYPVAPATTWSTWWAGESALLGRIDFDTLALDSEGVVDRADDVVTRPYQLLAVAYASFVEALRGRSDAPVYLYPYDWRVSVVQAAQQLVRYVATLQRKPLAVAGWDRRFDFAVHSMGGLVLRAFLAAWKVMMPADPLPVGRVVFIATPHLGSLDAVEALIRGETAIFGGRKEMRKLARGFPAVYELLPRFPHAVMRDGVSLDVFNLDNWQTNVTPAVPDLSGFDVTQKRLTAAKTVLGGLPVPSAPPFNVPVDDLLVIYGLRPGSTMRQVNVGLNPKEREFNWYDFDHVTKGDGDDVVPVESARALGTAAVEINIDDLSYLDLKARLVSMHAFLPGLDEVGTITSRFFQGTSGATLVPRGMPDGRYKDATP
jgi:hypothetical protein